MKHAGILKRFFRTGTVRDGERDPFKRAEEKWSIT